MRVRSIILGAVAALSICPAHAEPTADARANAAIVSDVAAGATSAKAPPVATSDWSGAAPKPRPEHHAIQVSTEAPLRPKLRPLVIPDARWDHRPGGRLWTMAGLRAMAGHGQRITDVVPRDISAWCPDYHNASLGERRAFWVGFLSALAFHESTWRADAVGGGGQWYGLLQIYPQTARHFRCNARTGDALKDGAANVACAIRILNQTIPRDRAIALRDGRWRGVAADWGPMRDAADVAQMQSWTRRQPYCRIELAPRVSLRPVKRPEPVQRVARGPQ